MSSYAQIRLFFIVLLVHVYHCYNSYHKEVGPQGEDIWRSTSDFVPVQSQPYGTIRLGQIMSAEFDFIWVGRSNYPRAWYYENFFRVGYDATRGINCEGQGARYPSFWLSSNDNSMHVSTSSGSFCQPTQSLQEYGPLNTSVSYHVIIAFNNTQLLVQISGGHKPKWSKIWKREPTLSRHIGAFVPVWWMSNKYSGTPYNIGNGIFSNIIITSSIFSTTIKPTSSPTSAPSSRPVTPFTVSVLSTIAPYGTDMSTVTPSTSTTGTTTTVSVANGNNMLYIHHYVNNKTNIILLSVTVASCAVGICLLGFVLKNRKRVKPDGKRYERANSVHVDVLDEGGRERMDTFNLNIGEDDELNDDISDVDDMGNMSGERDSDDDIVKEVNETANYVHGVLHHDIDGDLETNPVVDIYPACIAAMDGTSFCE